MKLKAVFSLLLMLVICTACTDNTSDSDRMAFTADSVITDWQSYTIIRTDMDNADAVNAMLLLRNAIQETLGVSLKLGTDLVKHGESAPVGTKEILIGTTNRPESEVEGLRYNDYVIKFENDRLVINAGNGNALTEAVNAYIECCIKDALYAPSEAYIYHHDYPMADGTIGGVRLDEIEYVLSTSKTLDEAAVTVADKLGELCGVRPSVTNELTESGKYIQLGCVSDDERISELEINEGTVKWVGDCLLIATRGNYNFPHSLAADHFISNILGDDNAQNSLEERITITMNGSYDIATDELIKGHMDKLEQMIVDIKNSPTTVKYTGTAYYVSADGNDSNDGKSPETPWKTVEKVNSYTFNKGDCVFFRRGDTFRMSQLFARNGVTYSAYGEGAKPRLMASLDGSGTDKWLNTKYENVYEYSEKISSADVGNIIFDGGRAWGLKIQRLQKNVDGTYYYNDKRLNIGRCFNGLEYVETTDLTFKDEGGLQGNLEFWFNEYTGKLYLYCDMGNPGAAFEEIEIAVRINGILLGQSDITLDNLTVFGAGAHGVGGGDVKNVTVQYCTFEWIGGAEHEYQPYTEYDKGADGIAKTRYGNACESYGSSDNFVVHDCYASQIYDSCWTVQYQGKATMKNVSFYNNVSEYSTACLEIWNGGGSVTNIDVHDNYSRFNGYGWAHQRPNHWESFYFFGETKHGGCYYRDNDFHDNVNLFATYCAIMGSYVGTDQLNLHDNVFIIEDTTRIDSAAWPLSPKYNKESEKFYFTKEDPLGDMLRYYTDHRE